MRIAVFGPTGTSGLELVKTALDHGFEIIAYARSLRKINWLQK